jgi:hypothetical protein
MLMKRRKLFRSASVTVSVTVAVISAALLWTAARTASVAPTAHSFSRVSSTTSTVSPVGGLVTPSLTQNNQGKAAHAPTTTQAEPLTLKASGFEPDELTRTASPFVLVVSNRSGIADVSFELFREDGHKMKEVKGPKGAVRPMKLIDLPPGNYLLKEVSHPEWTCRIALSR